MKKLLLAIILAATFSTAIAAPVTYTFTWTNSTSPAAIGNLFGCGPAPGNYGAPVDVKNVQTWSMALDNAVDWYCNVRAYDAAGNFSSWNGEVKVSALTPPSNLKAALKIAQNNLNTATAKVASYKSNSNTPNKAAAIITLQKATTNMAVLTAQVQ